MGIQIKKVSITNFRSINKLKIDFINGKPLIISGPNNVGKTNFLRALDLFFSMNKMKYDVEVDVPFHIAEGSGGSGVKTQISVEFVDDMTLDKYIISSKFTRKSGETLIETKGKKNNKSLKENEIVQFLSQFRYFYIESNNINLPNMISDIFTEEVLPDLDKLRSRQKNALILLKQFNEKAQEAVVDIEKGITLNLKKFVNEVDGLHTKNWNVKIMFPQFDYLREAISKLVSYTLFDSNDRELDTKGSGVQRLILLSLIKYISDNAKENIIWGIDEPEVFLQPGLQRKVFEEFKSLAKNHEIILTTHSPHFIDIDDLENTYLFKSDSEIKEYVRKPGKHFIKINTKVSDKIGFEKIEEIKKHMGIGRNDGWNITPFNLLVEGELDKDYILALANWFNFDPPNILCAGGADKIIGYLEFLKEFCSELDYKPIIKCVFDHDSKGKDKLNAIRNKKFTEFDLHLQYVQRYDGISFNYWEYEIEDLIFKEILIDGANKILRKKGYSIIGKRDLDKKEQKAYLGIPILKFINQIVRNNNPDKDPIDFESQGMKIYLCREACVLLGSKNQNNELNNKYPEVKKFIEDLFGVKEPQYT